MSIATFAAASSASTNFQFLISQGTYSLAGATSSVLVSFKADGSLTSAVDPPGIPVTNWVLGHPHPNVGGLYEIRFTRTGGTLADFNSGSIFKDIWYRVNVTRSPTITSVGSDDIQGFWEVRDLATSVVLYTSPTTWGLGLT